MSDAMAISTDFKERINIKTWQLFISLVFLNMVITLVYNTFIMTKDTYYSLFSAQLETYRIDEFYEFFKRISIYGYLIIPVFLWVKIAFVTLLIQLPFLIKYIEVSFKEIFRAVTLAGFVYILFSVVKIVWIKIIPSEQLTNDFLGLSPFALTNLLHYTSYSKAALAILNNVNVFEIGWIIIIVKSLAKTNKITFIDSSLLVLCVWIFITLAQFGLVYYLTEIY